MSAFPVMSLIPQFFSPSSHEDFAYKKRLIRGEEDKKKCSNLPEGAMVIRILSLECP